MAMAQDILDDIQRCVLALVLDEGESLTIVEVLEEAREQLKDYYTSLLERVNANGGL